MAQSTDPLEVDRQLHEFTQYHHKAMRRFFSACGLFNGHPFMLFLVRETPGITPAQLARKMEIAPASATVSIRRLEEAGLLRREPDERDRRVVHLTLTPAGVAMDDRCRRGRDFAAASMFRDFTPEELSTLSGLLERMRQNITHADAEAWLRDNSFGKDDET